MLQFTDGVVVIPSAFRVAGADSVSANKEGAVLTLQAGNPLPTTGFNVHMRAERYAQRLPQRNANLQLQLKLYRQVRSLC